MHEPKENLDALRREIDEIDTALHDLIMRRASVVEHIAATKGRPASSAMRPGREAEILRRLAARHGGPFPRAALLRIWRELIASLTAMQGPYAIAVYADGADQGCWDLARDHFGSHTDIAAFRSPLDVLARVADGKATQGVLPYPDAQSAAWWARLGGVDAPRIVQYLPFAEPGNARGEGLRALVLARVAPEPTGNDRTLLLVETAGATARNAVDAMLARAGVNGRAVASQTTAPFLTLVDAEGFLGETDAGLVALAAQDGVRRIATVGAYPVPLAPER